MLQPDASNRRLRKTDHYRNFCVNLPSGLRYWTVLESDTYEIFAPANEFLFHLRVGLSRAESTTLSYSTSIALLLEWSYRSEIDWKIAAPYLSRFIYWLQWFDPAKPKEPSETLQRTPQRVNVVLTAVRQFYDFQISRNVVPGHASKSLYRNYDGYMHTPEANSHSHASNSLKARHSLTSARRQIRCATQVELAALLEACKSSRDRALLLLMARAGTRLGELLALQLEDVHLAPESKDIGCGIRGPHIHIVRREDKGHGIAKSRNSRVVPLDRLTVQALDLYYPDRFRLSNAHNNANVFVNFYGSAIGMPMRPDTINHLFERLSKRAKLARKVSPHMLRHYFATTLFHNGATLDVVRTLLGHASLSSTEIYLNPSEKDLREAVEKGATRYDSE